ncbi:MAG: zinc ribbon domain-containing protein [Clostridia bacterium]|nr:zinc ribbon domain-containing protein [Clostridia bacterium]
MADKKIFPGLKKLFSRKKKKEEMAKAVYAGPEYFRKKNSMADVYAGPEYFDRRPRTEKVYAGPPRDVAVEAVYAGPEMFGDGDTRRDGEPINLVYAGPEYFAKREPEPVIEAPVYAGPPVDVDIEEVYAGPEFFGEPEEPEDAAEAEEKAPDVSEEKKPEPSPAPFNGVYAGPDPAMFMMAYAGPQFYNNNGPALGGFFAPKPEAEQKKDENKGTPAPGSKFCPGCGSPVPEGSKFCPECGSVLQNDKGNS